MNFYPSNSKFRPLSIQLCFILPECVHFELRVLSKPVWQGAGGRFSRIGRGGDEIDEGRGSIRG